VKKIGTKEKQPNHTRQPMQTKRTNEAEPATNQAKQPTTMPAGRLITGENINPPKERFDHTPAWLNVDAIRSCSLNRLPSDQLFLSSHENYPVNSHHVLLFFWPGPKILQT
jgi:uncharacterized protein YifN (PemK superfamily)